MRLRRTLAFSRRALLQFRHDRRTFAFVLLMPLLMILIFGYTFGGDVKGIAIEVVNQDTGLLSRILFLLPEWSYSLLRTLLRNFDENVLSLHTNTNNEDARQIVHDGKAWAAILFPANFTQNFLSSIMAPDTIPSPKIEIYLDGSNPTIVAAVIKEVTVSVQAALKELSVSLEYHES